MDDSALLAAARALFGQGPGKVTKKANAILRRRGLSQLTVIADFSWAGAEVDDIAQFKTSLRRESPDGTWVSTCDCGGAVPCVHTLTLCAALLGGHEHRVVPVAAVSGTPASPEISLREGVRAQLRRSLAPGEIQFLDKIAALHRQCQQGTELLESHLWQLGWQGRLPSFQKLELFKEVPPTEVTFWWYLADLAEERGYSIPPFLQKLEVPESLREARQAMKQEREVARWQKSLGSLATWSPDQRVGSGIELRFRWVNSELNPEIRQQEGPWQPLKQNQRETFHRGQSHGLRGLSSTLWSSYFLINWVHGKGVTLECLPLRRWLNDQLLSPDSAALFVDAAGEPVRVEAEFLQWALREPTAAETSYAFALVDSQGQSVGPVLTLLEGDPNLYCTARGIFRGPPAPPSGLTPENLASVPSPVMESPLGIRLLEWLRLAPTDRLRSKVTHVSLKVTLTLKLAMTDGVRCCQATATAADSEGAHLHELQGWKWNRLPGPGSGLDYLDFAAPQQVLKLLSKTDFVPHGYLPFWNLRLPRDYAEFLHEFLREAAEIASLRLCPELTSLQQGQLVGTLRLDATEAGPDWFDLQVVVRVEEVSLTPEELQALMAARGKWVRQGEHWRRLNYEITPEEESNLARIGLSPRQLGSEPQRLHALQLADPSARRLLPEAAAKQVERKASEVKSRLTPEVPAVIAAELRPYQREGFHFLAYLAANGFGGVLADDMGLGKTLQTLTWLAWLRQEGATESQRQRPSLVVCPKSVQDNWRSEAERFYPGLRVRLWRDVSATDSEAGLESADLHVANYAQLRSAAARLEKPRFLAVILDEGQNIKNPTSLTTQVASKLKSDYRLVLTGTPIENRLLDLWSLMSFAMPGVLGTRASFGRLYDSSTDPLARTRLSARVRPFLLRRTKAQVARDLPDRVEEDLYCEMEGEQRTLYRAELKVAQQALLQLKSEKAFQQRRFHFLTSLLRLRQICCHPALIVPDSKQAGAKVEALMETLEPLLEEGEKVLVFSQFVGLLALLRPVLASREWKQWYLAGETEDRGELVKEFQSHPGGGVFLISLKAGGAGLNLTAASYVILFDPWWNPAVENQAIDRTHRIGQSRKILAYRLLIKDSIEEKIRKLQKTKSALAEEVLGEERFASALTLDDLRFLLGEGES